MKKNADISFAKIPFPRGMEKRLCHALSLFISVPREDMSPAEGYLEDHAAFLLDEIDALKKSALRCPRLPAKEGAPRILFCCREEAKKGSVNEKTLVSALRLYLDADEITQAELDALPLSLAIAYLENINRAIRYAIDTYKARIKAKRLARAFSRGNKKSLPTETDQWPFFLSALSALENEEGEKQARLTLKSQGRSVSALEEARQEAWEKEALLLRRGVEGLKSLPRFSFYGVYLRLSPVEKALRQDETYRRMDRESRDFYLLTACRLSRLLHVAEGAAARAAVALARDQEGVKKEAGYYLIERPDLIARYLMKRSFSLRPFSPLRLLLPLYLGAAAALSLLLFFRAPWFLLLPLLVCSSQILRQGYFFILRRRFPPRQTPRIHMKALSESSRTLVVIPALLAHKKQVSSLFSHLNALRCANPDPNLEFMLLGDFRDAQAQTDPEDEEIILAAKLCVQALNDQGTGAFYYLQRQRSYAESQGCFSGFERKRGALLSLNQLIVDGKTEASFVYSSCPLSFFHRRYSYVITLDADTFLPPGAAIKMVGAMEHPLQKNRIALLQPRMETEPLTVTTRTQKYLGGAGGADPYHLSVQDVYQDTMGRGSFVGKGIYQPALFLSKTRDLPNGRLLSHDLIEGEKAVCALLNDIPLYDGHPASLAGWQKRLHRWTRGDWQLLPFLLDRRLSLLSRHKIWDNLLRSLVPFFQILVCLLAVLFNNPFFFLLSLPYPFRGMLLREILLPGKAYTLLDAAIRSLYRQFISKKNLLSWVTAAEAEGKSWPSLPSILFQILSGAFQTFLSLRPGGFLPGVIPGLLWASAPLLIRFMDGEANTPRPMTPSMEKAARDTAKRTWRFFEACVTEKTLFLPPDNVQMDPDKGAALRTSPTNIGLYLLSCCAARELGLISSQAMGKRVQSALFTMQGLETWKGHWYNWYDLKTGKPLAPRFVSSVDSGNLLGCLLCCAQLLRKRLAELPSELQFLPKALDDLAGQMDMKALYDEKSHLFYVGYEAEEKRFTPSHYDYLASEARLLSYLFMMKGGDEKHWRRLNRSLTRAGGGAALLSWGGTMFEYLLPNLLLPIFPDTLLYDACKSAVLAQMNCRPSRPFGISESGYFAFDQEMNYQYRAFGLPLLSVSGETEGQVIAPYASVLSLPLLPRAAGENLKRMRLLGWQDEFGFYEAADYTPRRFQKSPALVKSHMAHHQGMILCAICNALCKNALVSAFMALPHAQAQRLLLEESAPRHALPKRSVPPKRLERIRDRYESRPARSGFPLDAHVLYGGGTVWAISGRGQGFLRHQNMMITRFSQDVSLPSGPRFYLRDAESGRFMCVFTEGKAVFEEGAVRWNISFQGIEGAMYLCVDPLTGAAAANLMLKNSGKKDAEIEAVSFLEIAQGEQKADEAHPNFRDLSVRIEKWENHGLISRRLPRDEKDAYPLIGHFAAGDAYAVRRQGDKLLFLGRDGSYEQPRQLCQSAESCVFRVGDTVFPCLSLRVKMLIPSGKSSALAFFTLTGRTEKELNASALTLARGREMLSLSRLQGKMTLRRLRLPAQALPLYQQMLGCLLFSNQPHQAVYPPAPLQTLWRFGVSGEKPVLLVILGKDGDRALLSSVLTFHAWMTQSGIFADLLILCPKEKAYRRLCHDRAAEGIAKCPEKEGIFLLEGDEQDAGALRSLSRLTLSAGKSLKSQLEALREDAMISPAVPPSASLPQPPLPLRFGNSFGGFLEDGSFAVTSPAPAPWHHILSGSHFGTLVCETGILHSFWDNSRLSVLTAMSRDPRRPKNAEEITLRLSDGSVWSLTQPPAFYQPGAAEYKVKGEGFSSAVTVFSSMEKALGLRVVSLKSEKEQKVTLTYRLYFQMGEKGGSAVCSAGDSMVFARSPYLSGCAFSWMEGGDSIQCQGNTAVLEREISFLPRESKKIVLALGYEREEGKAEEACRALFFQEAWGMEKETRRFWSRLLSAVTLYSQEDALDLMMNLYLPYQVLSSRFLARMGPYQAGGAFGFRDQLQDCLAILYLEPERVRRHLLLCAAHQYTEGDVQHWWHPERRGVRTRISDDRLFLPFVVSSYVSVTGDQEILRESVPYLVSAPLGDAEADRYEEPEVSDFSESLLFHCLRAIDSVSYGSHGLPLMGGGDWNDGMNRVGGRKGESVWLGFFLAFTIREFSPLCPLDVRERLEKLRRNLLDCAESAWTGQWYLRAWQDDGKTIGGPESPVPRIDLISQCFSVFASSPRHHARRAVQSAVERLYDREGGLVKLLFPPFTPEENAGYIGAYLPGVRENGGQYTHAVPWLILSLCQLGDAEGAWEILKAVLPPLKADTREKALRYQVEPYVTAGDVYAGENMGQGGWTWYTGSAAWLYYVVLTALLGFQKRGNRARLCPLLPKDAQGFSLIYRFENAVYHFTAARDTLFPTLDGARLEDGWVTLRPDGRTHEARFPIRGR